MKQFSISLILAGFIRSCFLDRVRLRKLATIVSPSRAMTRWPISPINARLSAILSTSMSGTAPSTGLRQLSISNCLRPTPTAICRNTTIGVLRRWRKAKRCVPIPNIGSWSTVALYLFGKSIGPGLMKADPAAMKREADKNWPTV